MLNRIDRHNLSIIKDWWEERGQEFLWDYPFLPENGFIAYVNNKPTIASFMYVDSNYTGAWAIWTTANPKASLAERDKGYKEIIDTFTALARSLELKFIFTEGPDTVNYCKRIESCGFSKLDSNMAHFIKIIT